MDLSELDLTFAIEPIIDDLGSYAITCGPCRVDLFTSKPCTISISEPELSPEEARLYALLLIVAAHYAELREWPETRQTLMQVSL